MGDSLAVKVRYGGLVVGTISQGQGCPSRGGIGRKPEAKSRPDEQESHTGLAWGGRVCHSKRSTTLPEPHTVDATGT